MVKNNLQGFIGLGNMGSAIAEQMVKNGVDLLVFDLDKDALAQLEKAGATACSSVREIADRASLVLTCLPTPAVSLAVAREVALGNRVEILADLSTIGRSSIMEMAGILQAAGIQLVDAPVSGGPLGARQGSLSLMLSGPQVASECVAQACMSACGNVTHIGFEPGQAQLSKVVNNGISMTAFLVSCEVVAAAVGAGIPAEQVLTFVNEGRGKNSGTITKLPKYILDRTFDMGPTLVSALKDQDLYLDEFEKAELPVGVIAGTRELWGRTAQILDPEADAATIIHYFERLTGVEVTSSKGRDAEVRPDDAEILELADSAIAYTVLAATCEAVTVGLKGGIVPNVQMQLLNAGTACSYWSESIFTAQILTRRFESGASIGEACDVLRRYLELAAGSGLSAGLVHCALDVWNAAATELGADRDVTEMIKRYERVIGVNFEGVN